MEINQVNAKGCSPSLFWHKSLRAHKAIFNYQIGFDWWFIELNQQYQMYHISNIGPILLGKNHIVPQNSIQQVKPSMKGTSQAILALSSKTPTSGYVVIFSWEKIGLGPSHLTLIME